MTTSIRAPMRARVPRASLLASFVALVPCGPALAHAHPRSAQPVDWHATSTDTHKTQGSYRFTVAP
jgi:methionine-rich copper-binding protein CopC